MDKRQGASLKSVAPSGSGGSGPVDSRRLSAVNDGDLGLFGLTSPSPPHSAETFHNAGSSSPPQPYHKLVAPSKPSSRPGSASSAGAHRRPSNRLGQLQGNGSSTSLHTSYYSAEEGGANFSPNASATEDSPAFRKVDIGPPPLTLSSQPLSPASTSSRPGSASRPQAMSIAEETELNPPATSSPRGSKPRAKRPSRTRLNLPPPDERLPVGGGGPSAPPRSASVRSFDRRSSIGGGSSNHGHGDLGSGLMPGISSQMSAVGSPVLPNASPSIGGVMELGPSPRAPLSGAARSPPPDRDGSLPASPGPNSRFASPTGTQAPMSPFGAGRSPGGSRRGSIGSAATHSGSPHLSGVREQPKLDREALQRWVLSIGCVTFDLELGPELEFLYPPLGISREERDNIAFSSFPDTSIFDDGFSVFSWRVREVPLDSSQSEPPTIRGLAGACAAPAAFDDNKTPRPSIARTLSQATMQSRKTDADDLASPPLSPLSASNGSRSKGSSSSNSRGISRHASDANLQASSSSSGSSFRETLTHRLFPSQNSSSSGSGSRFGRHDRKPSASSADSSVSADEDADLAAQAAAVQIAEGSSASVVPAPKTADSMLPRRTGNSTSSSYIYGYVFFRQKRDPTSRRGYFQKSVVILSHLPYVGLFSEMVARLGPLYFEHGMAMFEAFANDVVSWSSPQPGSVLTLPLLGSIITAAIPFGQQAQNSPNADVSSPPPSQGLRNTATMTIRSRSRSQQGNRELPEPLIGPGGPLLASIPETSLFETFKEGLADLWLLWECVLLAEPILVIGPDPKVVSEAVWHMLDLIRPIPYAGDFRPYFHIHDYDFRTLVTKNKPQAGTLIGATNPFFATTCGHWPHVLRVGKAAVKVGSGFKHGSALPSGSAVRKVGGGHGAGGGGPDHVPGFSTKRKRRVSKERVLLKRLLDLASLSQPSKAEKQEGNVALRRYFADLTERFLAPLNRYVASLVPASFDLASPSEAPKIRPFNTTAFLASLKAHGTPIPLRSRSLPTGANVRMGLYLDFLKCPNFSLWLHSRVAAAEEEQRRRYIAALVQGDVTTFGNTKGEIETIDLYGRIVEEIRLVDVQLTSPTEPGPGSRWRSDKSTTSPSSTTESQPPIRSHLSSTGAGSGRSTPTASSTTSAMSWPTTEKRLVEQKKRLLDQLDRLCETLPDDLKRSLKRPS